MSQQIYLLAQRGCEERSVFIANFFEALAKKGDAKLLQPFGKSSVCGKNVECTQLYTMQDVMEMLSTKDTLSLYEEIKKRLASYEKNDYLLCVSSSEDSEFCDVESVLNEELPLVFGMPIIDTFCAAGMQYSALLVALRMHQQMRDEKYMGVLVTVVYACALSEAEKDALRAAWNTFATHHLCIVSGTEIETRCIEHITELVNKNKHGRRNALGVELTLYEKAKSKIQRIVLPEGNDKRVVAAAAYIAQHNIARVILLGVETEVKKLADELGVSLEGITIYDPVTSAFFEDYAQTYYELRKHKGMTPEKAREVMKSPSYFGTMMVYKNDADGMVSGAINTTADTIRPSLEFIKTKPGYSVVSSAFLMSIHNTLAIFADCAVNPNPTAAQLAEIAITSAETAKVFGIEPRVSMLSYSTGNSGQGPDVDLVKEATATAREKAPELALEGPLQYDASVDADVARIKLPNSAVAGRANVFIFPNLTAGNICYKAVQRTGASAYGPFLQGLKKPVNDLSRGCFVNDIVVTVAVTAIQAQESAS